MKPNDSGTLPGLEGIRGIAALYVVLHHCYLLCFPGFPLNTGPAWAGWLLYGHFAVVVFIALSGFSLAVSPSRAGWRISSCRTFAQRRAWRILPAYWAALAISLWISTLVPQPGAGAPTFKSVWVYGFLLQDIFGAPTPNGALWSIAVEAQLYAIFPLLLLLKRHAGVGVMMGMVLASVTLIGWLAPSVPVVHLLIRLTPQFALLFAVGVAAAALIDKPDWSARLPWLTLLAGLPTLLMVAYNGSEWTVRNLYWIDLTLAPAVGLLLAGVVNRRPAIVTQILETRAIRGLGRFSYSLYLIHAPIVVAVYQLIVAPAFGIGGRAFGVMLILTLPTCLLFAKGFASVFELPFQRHRTWPALRGMLRTRLSAVRTEVA